MYLLLFLSSLAFAQETPCAATPEDIDLSLQDAESAYEMGDEPGAAVALKRAELTLPCLSAVLPSPVAARFHRVHGLVAYISGDELSAALSFGAARLLEPSYAWPESVVAPGADLLTVYAAYNVGKVKKLKVPAPPEGALYLDGQPAKKRAQGMPVLLQLADGAGTVVRTAWLAGEEPIPSWTLPEAAPPVEAPPEPPPVEAPPPEPAPPSPAPPPKKK